MATDKYAGRGLGFMRASVGGKGGAGVKLLLLGDTDRHPRPDKKGRETAIGLRKV